MAVRQNVIHLQKFYTRPLGLAALGMAMRRVTSLWPIEASSGQDVLGFGYAAPFIAPYISTAKKVILAMPGGQGAMVTESRRGNITCLTEEDSLPFPPASFDRIIVAHGLEDSPCVAELMDEFWRIMKPEGRLMIICVNRSGLWARSDSSPFGHGRPFSRSQLSKLLSAAKFIPEAWAGALYVPPSKRLMQRGTVRAFERFGETVWPRFSGLVLVQAVKRLYADTTAGTAQAVRAPKFVGVTPAKTSLQKSTEIK